MKRNSDYIISLLKKEFETGQIKVEGTEIVILLKENLSIKLSIIEEEILVNPLKGNYLGFRNKAKNQIMEDAIERIKATFQAEQINCVILHLSGSANR